MRVSLRVPLPPLPLLQLCAVSFGGLRQRTVVPLSESAAFGASRRKGRVGLGYVRARWLSLFRRCDSEAEQLPFEAP